MIVLISHMRDNCIKHETLSKYNSVPSGYIGPISLMLSFIIISMDRHVHSFCGGILCCIPSLRLLFVEQELTRTPFLVANLCADDFSDILSEHTSGVYFGWAGLSARGIYKMVMSVGWNPYFDNNEKTIVSLNTVGRLHSLFLSP